MLPRCLVSSASMTVWCAPLSISMIVHTPDRPIPRVTPPLAGYLITGYLSGQRSWIWSLSVSVKETNNVRIRGRHEGAVLSPPGGVGADRVAKHARFLAFGFDNYAGFPLPGWWIVYLQFWQAAWSEEWSYNASCCKRPRSSRHRSWSAGNPACSRISMNKSYSVWDEFLLVFVDVFLERQRHATL